MKILFVCSRNKRRSRTAEKIFKNHNLFYVKSAGFSEKSPVRISEQLILWADLIFLMEYEHSKRLRQLFDKIDLPKTEVLNIKDNYEFMDQKLVSFLNEKVNNYLEKISI
ncbi:protein-tyrosine-phosphatase [Flavobacterium rhamnosiphilum]|uniref:Protein-tyrosine-phosphatase n=1 Tax=Flavobacterium rhamnosiphilum TaxID=2541724 RepID=A0A4R5F6A4_9FLAO|nr:protein-tyrosine-phosphatase [Flavobacterium rhamnosiphilum]TDE43465.1 protein-tyrosine-phosphatase [Flavobacterium rhamnosiphilum]